MREAWRYSSGRLAKYAQAASAQRARGGVSRRANSWRRCSLSIFGSGMDMGQTSSQRPHRVEALGSGLPSSRPTISGVSTAPIGPG